MRSVRRADCVAGSRRGRSSSGMMTIALPGAGQTKAQTPQPVQVASVMVGRPESTAMAPGTGQRSAQTEQNEPFHARHADFWMNALAILIG